MAKHTRKLAGIRIGPITILVFVITLCIAVLATLSVATARANTASTERQISFTNDVYANETAAQTMLSLVDAALANGTDGVRANLSAIEKETQASPTPKGLAELESLPIRFTQVIENDVARVENETKKFIATLKNASLQ